MRPIRINVVALIEKINRNRAAHEFEWREAMGFYLTDLQDKLFTASGYALEATVDNFRLKDAGLTLPSPPPNYLSEYDTALEMLTWSEDVDILLEEEDFRRLVKDEWGWSGRYKSAITACNDVNALRGKS